MAEVFLFFSMKLKGVFNRSSTSVKLIQFIALVVLSALLFMTLGLWITGGDMVSVNSLKINQFFQHLGLFFIPSILVAYLWSANPFRYLYIQQKPTSRYVVFTIILMMAAIPAINLLGEINASIRLPESLSALENLMKEMEINAEILTQKLLNVHTYGGLLINIALIALLPAVGEELFFRGIIQRLFQEKLNAHAAIWLTGIIFSLIHFQFYGFIPRMLMGTLFGYLLWWTGSLWVPIVAHFTNNALAVIFYFFYNRGDAPVDLENLGKSDTIAYGILSILIVTIMIVVFWRNKVNPQTDDTIDQLGNQPDGESDA